MDEAERERIADKIDERALYLSYFIARALLDGDLDCANEALVDEVDSYSQGSGGAGVMLARLQSLGLIDDLTQTTLHVPDEAVLNRILATLESEFSPGQLPGSL